jgi:hypothetical protein
MFSIQYQDVDGVGWMKENTMSAMEMVLSRKVT